MLATAFEADAARHDHFVRAFDLIKGLLKNRRRVLSVPDKRRNLEEHGRLQSKAR
jgi:hypothetical protein